MTRRIKKVAIVGSGIMGSGIACHFANIGVEVLLLDIIPRELNDKEKAKGLSLKDSVVRNMVSRVWGNSFDNGTFWTSCQRGFNS